MQGGQLEVFLVGFRLVGSRNLSKVGNVYVLSRGCVSHVQPSPLIPMKPYLVAKSEVDSRNLSKVDEMAKL